VLLATACLTLIVTNYLQAARLRHAERR
jgi:hypothetical protein